MGSFGQRLQREREMLRIFAAAIPIDEPHECRKERHKDEHALGDRGRGGLEPARRLAKKLFRFVGKYPAQPGPGDGASDSQAAVLEERHAEILAASSVVQRVSLISLWCPDLDLERR